MTRIWRTFLVLVFLAAASNLQAAGNYYEVSYPPSDKSGELIFGVTYTVWIPDGVTKLRGVIVHQHGCGAGACRGGATAAYDLHWQALARKWDCLCSDLRTSRRISRTAACGAILRNGSEQAFLKAPTIWPCWATPS